MDRVLILHYHEIWLKGKNKRYFLSRLTGAVKRALADLPAAPPRFISERLVVEPREDSVLPIMLERLSGIETGHRELLDWIDGWLEGRAQ